ncbi:HEAT repeat-containing protein 3-like [Tubulanus polymorphus]|uniref:HEAT repeat-containing protein 3-like n=1 Tax=Tubulanus polymorphus TaxID=672921 RepID=UPI003DA26217
MGKVKHKRQKPQKPRPTGIESVAEVEQEEAELETPVTRTSHAVASIVDKLHSGSAEERECGCTTIATIVDQPGAVAILLDLDVVRILGPLMVDQCVTVRQAAIGALRNLSVVGGYEVCDQMIDNDVMTPLIAILQQYKEQWQPEKASSKMETDPKTDVFLQATHLLWNLCESNQTAVSIVNQQNIIPMFLSTLDPDMYGFAQAIATAQFLQIVSENNPDALPVLSSTEAENSLRKLISSEFHTNSMQHVFLKTLASGILYNVSCGKLNTAKGNVLTVIVEVLMSIIRLDTTSNITEIAEKLMAVMNASNGTSSLSEEDKDKEHVPDVNHKSIDAEIEKLHNILSSQQLALEIIANLSCSDDEEWEELDSAESSADEMACSEPENQMDMLSPTCVPTEVLSLFADHQVLTEVVKKIPSLDARIAGHLSHYPKGKKLLKSIHTLQSRALNNVNNMASNMEPDALGGLKNLHLLWLKLTQIAVTETAVKNEGILEAVTGAMRAVVQRLAQLQSPEFKDVTLQDLNFLFEMGSKCNNADVRANTLRIVSTIGCMLAQQVTPHSLLKNIGLFLVELASNDSELWVTAEALDGLFDVFAEDHVDPIVKEIALVPKLKQIAPALKVKVQQQKKKLGEHLPIVTTARTNLNRFIKYKNS